MRMTSGERGAQMSITHGGWRHPPVRGGPARKQVRPAGLPLKPASSLGNILLDRPPFTQASEAADRSRRYRALCTGGQAARHARTNCSPRGVRRKKPRFRQQERNSRSDGLPHGRESRPSPGPLRVQGHARVRQPRCQCEAQAVDLGSFTDRIQRLSNWARYLADARTWSARECAPSSPSPFGGGRHPASEARAPAYRRPACRHRIP